MLARIVVRRRLRRQDEMRLDDIGDAGQNRGGALLPVLIDENLKPLETAPVHRRLDLASGRLVADFVAAQRMEPDRLQHIGGLRPGSLAR